MTHTNNHQTHQLKAILIGFSAILMWSFMATFTAYSGKVPPFLITSIAMFIGSLPGIFLIVRQPRLLQQLKQPLKVWCVGIGGLFGYQLLYFTALRNAPPAEAGLINYLWPLLIVLGSALMPGEKLRWFHLVGALMGFLGMLLVVMKSGSFGFESKYYFGYLMALAGSFVWACYSLLSRRFKQVPSILVGIFCLASSILSFICHIAFAEANIWPTNSIEWFATIGLGLFPVGLAFYCWDFGVKHGNIQLLGAASYATPMLSTILLVIFGIAEPTWQLAVACLLITAGAILASKNLIFQKSKQIINNRRSQ